ncbi:hypothetical protein RFI_33548, partial [Reticulomyxa filosa]
MSRAIIDAMAVNVDVRLNHRVTKITYENDKKKVSIEIEKIVSKDRLETGYMTPEGFMSPQSLQKEQPDDSKQQLVSDSSNAANIIDLIDTSSKIDSPNNTVPLYALLPDRNATS